MSAIAILLIIFGLSIALSRAPLVVAPQQTRDAYLRLFDTDGKMRVLMLVMGVLGLAAVWVAWGMPGTVETIVYWLGVLILALAAGAVAFPGYARKLATNVWMSFGPTTMRIMGGLAVVFGLFLVYYGLSL